MAEKLKIAFFLPGSGNWLGGLNYQLNLVEALLHFESELELNIIISKVNADIRLPQSRSVKRHLIRDYPVITGINAALRRVLNRDLMTSSAVHKTGAKVVFSSFPYIAQAAPTLYWIPDFQHVHFPEMFTPRDIIGREKAFRIGAAGARRVVLSSRNAMEDFTRLFPSDAHKARILHFAVRVPDSIYEVSPMELLKGYNLPRRFFYIPNQLWKHKNHLIILEALHILRSRKIYPIAVCTGNTLDYRTPGFFSELMEKIGRWSLGNQVIFAGLMPREHVFQLIRQSIAVINPSLFEGWSTSVEEAKSIGKKMLLSNIPVHQEQAPPECVYFDPNDARDVAEKLAVAWDEYIEGPDLQMEACARSSVSGRVASFAKQFVSMAREILPV